MGSPFPPPEPRASRARGGRPGPRRVATKLTYVALDLHGPGASGPSGIKQCFRTVKSLRRVPLLAAPAPAPPRRAERPPKKHACRHCGKRFGSPGKLAQHALAHTGELPFGCQHCHKKFNSKFKLVRHGLIHSETRPFACALCDKSFHRKDHLSNHARIHNPEKRVYVCEKDACRKRYTSQLSFRKHTALHSAEEGNLQCKICSKVFDSQAEIVYHLKVHAGSRTVKNETDKKFNCPQCERKFFTGKDVRRHLVVHTGRRDFLCQFCPQKFGRKDHLVRHVKKAHPNEQWQASTPGSSSAVPEPPDEPQPSTSHRKDKAESRKSRTKAELKFPRKMTASGESRDPSASKDDRPETPPGKVFSYQRAPPYLLPDAADLQKISEQQELFLTCDQQDSIKREPSAEAIKVEEMPGSLMYVETASTSKNLGTLMSSVDPGPSTSMEKYPQFTEMIYMMQPPPPYPEIASNIEIMQDDEISFVTQAEEDLDSSSIVEIDSGQGNLPILEQPEVDSLLMGEGDHRVSLRDEIMHLLESTYVPTLPTFNQAFQNTTQSPKPPHHPPK